MAATFERLGSFSKTLRLILGKSYSIGVRVIPTNLDSKKHIKSFTTYKDTVAHKILVFESLDHTLMFDFKSL